MDAFDLRFIYNLLLRGGSEEDKKKARTLIEREIRLKKMRPSFTTERNNKIFNDFMKEL